jgi:polar amino acid transport system substrate-binding protein
MPEKVFAACTEDAQGLKDNLAVSMQMDNGAAVGIVYASNGDKSFPREKVEVFAGGSVCLIENFKKITFVSSGNKKTNKSLEVDRGHTNEINAVIDALKNGKPSPIEFRSVIATMLATFAIEKSFTRGEAVEINLGEWGIN